MKCRSDREPTGDSVSDATNPGLEPQTSMTMCSTTSPTERNFPIDSKLELAGQRNAETKHNRYLGFDSRPGQIGHMVRNGSLPLRYYFGAVYPRR